MFESAALAHDLSKEDFERIEPRLREDLLDAQFDLLEAKQKSILVLINGSDGAGKGELLGRFYEWLDPHHLDTLSYFAPSPDERKRPTYWRFWRDMPARGRIGVVLGSWYHPALDGRARGLIDEAAFTQALNEINEFETMLAAEGVMLLKLWLYLPDKKARRRLKKVLRADGSRKRPVVIEWNHIDTKKERRRLNEAGLEMADITSTGQAPWHIVPGDNDRYRDIAAGRLLLEALRSAAAAVASAQTAKTKTSKRKAAAKGVSATALKAAPEDENPLKTPSVIGALDLTQSLAPDAYREELRHFQNVLTRATTAKNFGRRGLVVVMEGNDAAGKGGAILRIREALDPRAFRVHGVGAPSDEERAHPYLWRFWRKLPMRGQTAIFDRSWYGRVLVERVEGFCSQSDWLRAYHEIKDFERQLERADYTVVKLWLAISKEEQLRRFQLREDTPVKRYKITPEDWRNREKWDDYERAVNDMVNLTSTSHAPWTLVEANDKYFARVKVLRTIVEALEG